MDVAVDSVRLSAAVHLLGDVDLPADQPGVAPAAFAAAAVGGSGDAGSLQAAKQGLSGGGGDGPLRPGDQAAFSVRWSGTTSEPGCAVPREPVQPGAYTVVGQLGGLRSTPEPFNMTA